MKTKTKIISITTIIVILILVGIGYFKFYFVFGDGVKAGELNYLVHKGVVFKTYEGKVIQSGFKGNAQASIQSYEFKFSVEDKQIADSLMRCSGRHVELHYKEYMGKLPWRGVSEFIVDEIVAVH